VAAARVVPALDEFEDGQAGLDPGLEAAAVEEFALEGGEEALAERVVVGVADRSHRRAHTHLPTPQAKRNPRVLAALSD
jgi:hypothetical protein